MKLRAGLAVATAGALIATGCTPDMAKKTPLTAEQQAILDANAKKAATTALNAYVRLANPKICHNSSLGIYVTECSATSAANGLSYSNSTRFTNQQKNDQNDTGLQFYVNSKNGGYQELDVILDSSTTPVDKTGKRIGDELGTYTNGRITFVRPKIGSKAVSGAADIQAIISDPNSHVTSMTTGQSGFGLGSDFQTDTTIHDGTINLEFASFNPDPLPKPNAVAKYAATRQIQQFVSDISLL